MASTARTTPDPQEVAQAYPNVVPLPPGTQGNFPPYVLAPANQIPTYTNTPAVAFLPKPQTTPAPAPMVQGATTQPQSVMPGAKVQPQYQTQATPMDSSMAATPGSIAQVDGTQNGVVSAGTIQGQ